MVQGLHAAFLSVFSKAFCINNCNLIAVGQFGLVLEDVVQMLLIPDAKSGVLNSNLIYIVISLQGSKLSGTCPLKRASGIPVQKSFSMQNKKQFDVKRLKSEKRIETVCVSACPQTWKRLLWFFSCFYSKFLHKTSVNLTVNKYYLRPLLQEVVYHLTNVNFYPL